MASGERIILIDPAIDTTPVLAQRLQMQGYAVSTASDPAEGARLALADPPAAVIADLWMPSISGVQLCRLLRAEPATETVPVILRGPEAPRNHFWSERAGAQAYVVKGRMGELVRALAQAIALAPPSTGFFTNFSYGGDDIRERIAMRLDAALFESVLAAEVRALGTCGQFDRLFDLFSQFVSRVATYRWLAVLTEQPARLGLHASPSSRAQAEAEARAALGVPLATQVIAVEDDDADGEAAGPPPLVCSIELGGTPIGKLALATRDAASSQDHDLVQVLARELAGPIRMATLVEESQRLATIDVLTGLLNRRAFTAALVSEIARAERYGEPLSFALLDIDHFKAINDKRGHHAGDRVLAAIGQLLGRTARSADWVGRWGGEEFVIVLAHTGDSNALAAGERIREAVESLEICLENGDRVPVTASVGVAQFCHGDTLEALVERADQAMYAAKYGGRNRVVFSASREVEARPSAEGARPAS